MNDNIEYSSTCMFSLALSLMFICKTNVCLYNDHYVKLEVG